MQKDNSTLARKVSLRNAVLEKLPDKPVVLETHAGSGKIWERCYSHLAGGVAFDKNPRKTSVLALQRPTWRVYEGDCTSAIGAGIAADLPIGLIDCDPYGQPWPTLEAFFCHERKRAPVLGLAVNDGLRQKLKMGGGWTVESLQPVIADCGNHRLYERYLSVAREMIERMAVTAGYRIIWWCGYYCGHNHDMTHYAAMMEI